MYNVNMINNKYSFRISCVFTLNQTFLSDPLLLYILIFWLFINRFVRDEREKVITEFQLEIWDALSKWRMWQVGGRKIVRTLKLSALSNIKFRFKRIVRLSWFLQYSRKQEGMHSVWIKGVIRSYPKTCSMFNSYNLKAKSIGS